MYTPYVGYMYTRWWLIVLIWMVYIFSYWPFKRAWLERTNPVVKGAVLTLVSVVLLYILIKGFFEGILGNFGLTYFNPERMTKLPGVTQFFAIEYASLAILMFAAIASWLSPAWVVACEEAPWQDLKQPAKGFSILMVTFFLSTLLFFVTMHPHMGILYYPGSISPQSPPRTGRSLRTRCQGTSTWPGSCAAPYLFGWWRPSGSAIPSA